MLADEVMWAVWFPSLVMLIAIFYAAIAMEEGWDMDISINIVVMSSVVMAIFFWLTIANNPSNNVVEGNGILREGYVTEQVARGRSRYSEVGYGVNHACGIKEDGVVGVLGRQRQERASNRARRSVHLHIGRSASYLRHPYGRRRGVLGME